MQSRYLPRMIEYVDRWRRDRTARHGFVFDDEHRCVYVFCVGCGCSARTKTDFMVHTYIWEEVCKRHDIDPQSVLCIDCFQKRLGRDLTLDDLRHCPANDKLWVQLYNKNMLT